MKKRADTRAGVTTEQRIGLLGGTFDPIHRGHVDLARAAEAALGLTRILVIPADVPPHRPQPMASSHHRFAMVALTVAGCQGWSACDVELRAQPPSYTSVTLRRFRDRGFAQSELFFIVGADAFAEIATWKDYPEILESAHFAVVSRPQSSIEELPARMPTIAHRMRRPPLDLDRLSTPVIILIDAQTADVSSTAVRQLCADRKPVAGLVHPGVEQHIEQHGLYTSPPLHRRRNDDSPTTAAGRLHDHR